MARISDFKTKWEYNNPNITSFYVAEADVTFDRGFEPGDQFFVCLDIPGDTMCALATLESGIEAGWVVPITPPHVMLDWNDVVEARVYVKYGGEEIGSSEMSCIYLVETS